MKKASILIPSKEPGKYFSSCLDALQQQTLKSECFVVYVCLNGPREPYEGFILEELGLRGLQYAYIYSDEAGVSNARNLLIRHSNEEYLIFLDDDDVISHNYLEEILDVSSPVAVGASNVRIFDSELEDSRENYVGVSFGKLSSRVSSKFKARKFFSSVCGKCIHRDIVGSVLFVPDIFKGEDSLFMASVSGNIREIRKTSDNAFYYVRNRAGSVTRRKISFRRDFGNLMKLYHHYFKLLLSRKHDTLFILSRLTATTIHLLRILYRCSLGR